MKEFTINEIIDDWYFSNVDKNSAFKRLYNTIDERRELVSMLIGRIKEVGYDQNDISTNHKQRIVAKCLGNLKDRKKRLMIAEYIEEDIEFAIYQYYGKNAFKAPEIEKIEPQERVVSKRIETSIPIELDKLNLVKPEDRWEFNKTLSDAVDHDFCDLLGIPQDHRQ